MYDSEGNKLDYNIEDRDIRRSVENEKGTIILGYDDSHDSSLTGNINRGLFRSTDDGASYILATGTENIHCQSLSYGNNIWVCGNDSNCALTKEKSNAWVSRDDGITWERLGLADDDSIKLIDIDGVTEMDKSKLIYANEAQTVLQTKWRVNCFKFVNGQFWITFGEYGGGKNYLFWSNDLVTFYRAKFNEVREDDFHGARGFVWDICYGKGLYLCGTYGQGGRSGIGISEDGGKSWTRLESGNEHLDYEDLKRIVFYKDKFVAAGKLYTLYYSDDGKNWKECDPITYEKDGTTYSLDKFYDIECGDDIFVACGTGGGKTDGKGAIVWSFDGINWTVIDTGKYKTCWYFNDEFRSYDQTDGNRRLVGFSVIQDEYKTYYPPKTQVAELEPMNVTSINDIAIALEKLAASLGWTINLSM